MMRQVVARVPILRRPLVLVEHGLMYEKFSSGQLCQALSTPRGDSLR